MSVVYIIGSKELPTRHKIGWAKDPEQRIRELQTGSPVPLEIIGVIRGGTLETENELHVAFGQHRLHGEWFDIDRRKLSTAIAGHLEATSSTLRLELVEDGICLYCNESFRTKPKGTHRKFCSVACRRSSYKYGSAEDPTPDAYARRKTFKLVTA